MRARPAVLFLAAVLAAAPIAAQARLTKQDADRFQAKLTRIVEFGNAKPAVKAKASTMAGRRRAERIWGTHNKT